MILSMLNITKWQMIAAAVAVPVLLYANLVRKVKRNIALIKRYNPNKKVNIYAFYVPFPELFYRFDFLPDFMSPLPDRQWRTDPNVQGMYNEDGVFFLVSANFITMRVKNEKFIHEIYDRKNDFGKPIHLYEVLDVFGRNVVTMEGAEWKRHRKITAPQFSEKNNALVFDVTQKSILELIEIWKTAGLENKVDVLNDMFQLAMHVISGAAFGVQLKFREETKDLKAGHTLSFKQSLQHLATSLPIYIALPKWLISALPFKVIKDAKRDIEEFDAYMHELYQDAYDGKSKGNNLLNALVQAMKDDETLLSIRELLGNMFIFLFAGHETTANALTYALASLALNPTTQQRLYEEIQTVLGDDGEFTYAKLNQMPYSMAVMNETLRMYSPVEAVPKMAVGDQQLGDYILPDRANLSLHSFMAHYEKEHWGPDPLVFRPERWFADPECAKSAKYCFEKSSETTLKAYFQYSRYAFIPFSEGPRACLGKRFAEVEFMTAIVTLVRILEFKVPQGVSAEDLLKSKVTITYRPSQPVELFLTLRK